MTDSQVRSKRRIADHGEVFTGEREVKAMCDLVKQETERIESRFLEPACGNGNFLAEVLNRKLAVVKARYGRSPADYERYAIVALSSLYGVELLVDNAQEFRERLFSIWNEAYTAAVKKRKRPVPGGSAIHSEKEHPLRRRPHHAAGRRQPHCLCGVVAGHREHGQAPGF